jgi:putative signal transducing protein
MPPERRDDPHPGLTVVATASGMLHAEILKSKLEDAGIDAMLDYESAGLIFGITANGLQLSEVRVWVASHNAERAQHILRTPPPPGWEEEAISPADDD